jgi:hypothetical protein
VGIGKKLDLTFGETDISDLGPEEEVLLLHIHGIDKDTSSH